MNRPRSVIVECGCAPTEVFPRNTPRLVLSSAVALACIALASGACTLTTVNENGDDGGPDAATGGPDGSTGNDASGDATSEAAVSPDGAATALGFAPSNLGAALSGIDLTKLVDLDVTLAQDQAGAVCNSQSNDGCVAVNVTESGGATIVAYVAKSWKIEPAASIQIVEKTPVVLVAITTINILGRIDASGSGNDAMGGGFVGSSTVMGGGPGGGGIGSDAPPGPGFGAGGGGFCGAGGAGGNAAGVNGAAGVVNGSATLIPLTVGSAGGGGAVLGGGGGGAIQLVAGTSINIAAGGVVSSGGGGGGYGGAYGDGQSGSGGGSGGAVLLEAPQVTV